MTKESTIAFLRRLHEAATPAPWSEFCESGDWWVARKDADGMPLESVCNSDPELWAKQDDIELMTSARNALPALLRVAEAGKRYRSMCELFDKSLNRGDADTAYVNGMAAKRELFAALAALDEVQP